MFECTDWVERAVALCRVQGVRHLLGASSAGDHVIGAMLLASAGELRPWAPNSVGRTMVVDGPAVSDVGVRLAMERLKRVGETEIIGLIMSDDPVATGDPDLYVLPLSSPMPGAPRDKVLPRGIPAAAR